MIADSTNLPKLQVLDLCQNKIGDDGLISLITSQNYPKLVDLRIDTNGIEEKGAQAFSFGCNLNLTKLRVRNNNFKTKGCQFI